jgi:type IV pilus assembly protein PilN
MKVRLNLSTKPLQTHRKFLAGAGILGAIAGLFFIGLGLHVYAVRRGDEVFRERVVAVRTEMVSLEQQRRDLEQFFNQPENAKLHDRSAFLNTIIDEQSLNWTQMFMDLEKILPAGVRVVSIQPKHDKGIVEVKLTIGATNDEAKMKFLHNLEQSPSFSQLRMVTEKQVTPVAGETDKVDVELTVVYAKA